MGHERRFASLFLRLSFEGRKHCAIIRNMKVLVATGGKTVPPFLSFMLFLVFLAGMLSSDAAVGTKSSLLFTRAKIGVYASLSSLLYSSRTKTNSSSNEKAHLLRHNKQSSAEIPRSPSWASSDTPAMSTLSSYSAKSAAGHTLDKESKEIVSTCPPSCFRANPVCGFDGVTYWCGSVDAECAGVEVDYEGVCDFNRKGTGVKAVVAIQSLLLVHMVWLMLAAALVFLGVL